MINPLKHFGIKTQFIRGDTKSYSNKCTICGNTTGNYEHCPDCKEQEALIAKNPNSTESKFFKRELDKKARQND